VEHGLDCLAKHAAKWNIASLALPALGCGNGGLEWSEVGPLIYRKLNKLPIDIELYAPPGTAQQHLTMEFLSAPPQ
jgi:O-acetyl-ADP-ribose deacetylase (regulator of RNase III)